ncbi:glycosyltransferase family 4 protein, partial [Staphylococcus aureus]|uniref:glycosyltransferase family 4 protein n=1 Tax=Staphylococcus aureus TaxID=1280 RepID=UPI00201AC486
LIKTNTNVFERQFLKPIDRFFYFKKQKKILDWVHTLKLNIHDYDIVHAHTLFSDGYQALKTGKPYIVTVRNTDINFYMKFYKHLLPLGRKILEKASKIIFLSESYKKKTIDMLFGHKKSKNEIFEKSHVIPNGINDFWLKNSSNQTKHINEEINVICVCRIMKNKNLEFLAKNLIEKNLGRNINIYIIGDVVDSKYYQNLKSYPNMHFLGRKDKKTIVEIMKDMHMFIMVSFTETFGLVYLEALTQNLPVIYTKNEGFDKYFEDGYVGYSVNPTKNDELVMKVRKVVENYNEIQRNINQLDKNRFSWQDNAEKHKELYEITKASVE